MFSIEDDTVFEKFEEEEMHNPCPRKEVDGRIIYTSRKLAFTQNLGPPVLCDLGEAVSGDEEHFENVQPDIYRSPEAILNVPWSYKIDIWNVGCMVRCLRPDTIKEANNVVDLGPSRRQTYVLWHRSRTPYISPTCTSC
jgi:hypothetical protein